MNIVLDFGNSYLKIGVFKNDQLMQVFTSFKNDFLKLNELIASGDYTSAIVSSVIETPQNLIESLQMHCKKVIIFDHTTKSSLKNKYKNPETLGNDRLALATGASLLYKKKDILIIDAGSCITFDFVNKEGEYIGGGISPGIDMRFRSLNAFTDKLPLINRENISFMIGKNTRQCILSGVLNGIYAEINTSILFYKNKYKNTKIVLTGGDAIFLAKKIKSRTFAEPNFLLICLNQILLNNE
jgi:type III pantothenate kinase